MFWSTDFGFYRKTLWTLDNLRKVFWSFRSELVICWQNLVLLECPIYWAGRGFRGGSGTPVVQFVKQWEVARSSSQLVGHELERILLLWREEPVPGFPAHLCSPAFSMAQVGCTASGCVAPLEAPPPRVLTPWALPVLSERWSDSRMGYTNNILIETEEYDNISLLFTPSSAVLKRFEIAVSHFSDWYFVTKYRWASHPYIIYEPINDYPLW